MKAQQSIRLVRLPAEHTLDFKEEMQEAFQTGFTPHCNNVDEHEQGEILPDKDFYDSLNAPGAEAYEAIDADGRRVGGTILKINSVGHDNELAFLYVKVGVQGKGIGQAIWQAIETLHPETEVWHTCTPYFEVRNIHFYINCCGFHAVEFFNTHHPDPHMPEQFDQAGGLFVFEKVMKNGH